MNPELILHLEQGWRHKQTGGIKKTGSTDDRLNDDDVTGSRRPGDPVFCFVQVVLYVQIVITDRISGPACL